MIRLIIKGTYMLPTDKAETDYKTFDVDLPDIEKYLSEPVGYAQCGSREIIGAEIIPTDEIISNLRTIEEWLNDPAHQFQHD